MQLEVDEVQQDRRDGATVAVITQQHCVPCSAVQMVMTLDN